MDTDEKKNLSLIVSEKNESRQVSKIGEFGPLALNLHKSKIRFLILIFCCLTIMGYYFVYDDPAPLYKELVKPASDKGMGLNHYQYNLLFSFYSIPNFILPFIGGILIDKYLGKRISVILFAGLITFGQFVFSLASNIVKYNVIGAQFLLLGGRFILGLGGENLSVVQFAFLFSWFKGRELAMASGFFFSIGCIGTVLCDNFEPYLYYLSGGSFVLPFWFGFVVCVLSLITWIVEAVLDYRANKPIIEKKRARENDDIKTEVNLKDLRRFGKPYWLLVLICVAINVSLFTYQNVASALYQERFQIKVQVAAFLLSVPYLMCSLLNPLLGYFLDKIGMKTFFLGLASFLILMGHIIMAIIPQIEEGSQPSYRCVLGIILYGFGYCLYSINLWGYFPYCVDESLIGSAYGIAFSLENIGLGLGPILIAFIYTHTNNYKHGFFGVNLVCAVEALIALIGSIILFIYDYNHTQVLFSSTFQNKKKKRLSFIDIDA